jgi:hypothetical protein
MMSGSRATEAAAIRSAPTKEARRPYHIGIAIGLSAGVYATSLAAVTVLQVDHDKRLAGDRQPVGEAIRLLGEHHDAMEADLLAAHSAFDEASVGYESVVSGIGELHMAVKRLGEVIGRIEGTSTDFRLPSMVSLPSVPRGTSSKPASKPAARPPPSNGGTGASGH